MSGSPQHQRALRAPQCPSRFPQNISDHFFMIFAHFWKKVTKIGQIRKNRKVTRPRVIPFKSIPVKMLTRLSVFSIESRLQRNIGKRFQS